MADVKPGQVWVHVDKKTSYVVVSTGQMEVKDWRGYFWVDAVVYKWVDAVVYKSPDNDAVLYTRTLERFRERFYLMG